MFELANAGNKKFPLHHVSISEAIQFRGFVYRDESCDLDKIFDLDPEPADGTHGFVFIIDNGEEYRAGVMYHAGAKQWILGEEGKPSSDGKNIAYVNPFPDSCTQIRLGFGQNQGNQLKYFRLFRHID